MEKLTKNNKISKESDLEKTILLVECVKILDWNAFVLILEDLYRKFPNKSDGESYELYFMELPRYPERQFGIVFHGEINFGTRGILGFLPLPSDSTLFRVHIRAEKRPLAFVDLDYSNEVTRFVESYLTWMGAEILRLFPETTLVKKSNPKGKAVNKHKIAWKEIKRLQRVYKNEYESGNSENPNPKLEDYVTAVKTSLGRQYGERTIRRIIVEGEAGELD